MGTALERRVRLSELVLAVEAQQLLDQHADLEHRRLRNRVRRMCAPGRGEGKRFRRRGPARQQPPACATFAQDARSASGRATGLPVSRKNRLSASASVKNALGSARSRIIPWRSARTRDAAPVGLQSPALPGGRSGHEHTDEHFFPSSNVAEFRGFSQSFAIVIKTPSAASSEPVKRCVPQTPSIQPVTSMGPPGIEPGTKGL